MKLLRLRSSIDPTVIVLPLIFMMLLAVGLFQVYDSKLVEKESLPVVVPYALNSIDIIATADSTIRNDTKTTNYGSQDTVLIGSYGTGGTSVRRGVYSFLLPEESGVITKVTLFLLCSASSGYPTWTQNNYTVYPLPAGFTEAQVTWNVNQTGSNWSSFGGSSQTENPIAETTVLKTLNCGTTPVWLNWTLYGDGALNNHTFTFNALHNFIIRERDEVSGYYRIDSMLSKEYSNSTYHPFIRVEWESLSDPPTIPSLSLSPSTVYVGGLVEATIEIINSTEPMDKTWVEAYVDGSWSQLNITSAETGNITLAFSTSSFNEGAYSIRARVNDTLGSLNTSTSETLSIVYLSPGISIKEYYTSSLNSTLENCSVWWISSNETRNLTVYSTENHTNTFIRFNQTFFENVSGIRNFEVCYSRTADENKSRAFNVSVTSGIGDSATCQTETRIYSYPFAFFTDYSETPGSINRDSTPYSTWASSGAGFCRTIVTNTAEKVLCYYHTNSSADFSAAITAIEGWNWDCGLDGTRGDCIMPHLLAYNWIQPLVNSSVDIQYRRKLVAACHNLWTNRNIGLSCVDVHLREDPVMQMCGDLLSDFPTPASGSGGDEWSQAFSFLYENDPYLGYSQGLSSYCFDSLGQDGVGSYRNYYEDKMGVSHALWEYMRPGTRLYDRFPIAQGMWTQFIHHTLPNKFVPSYITEGMGNYYDGALLVLYLIDEEKQPHIADYVSNIEGTTGTLKALSKSLQRTYVTFLVYNGTDASYPPDERFFLNASSFHQSMRTSWDRNATWTTMYNLNKTMNTGRSNTHQDGLHIDYYSRGDLVSSDAGEIKYLYRGYGPTSARDHNVLLATDNDGMWWGIHKGGGVNILYSRTTHHTAVKNNVLPYTEVSYPWVLIAHRNFNDFSLNKTADNPALWKRAVSMPQGDYVVVFDRFNRSGMTNQQWRLSSLNLDRYSNRAIYTNSTSQTISGGENKSWAIEVTDSDIGNATVLAFSWSSKSGSGNISIFVNDVFQTQDEFQLPDTLSPQYIWHLNKSSFVNGVNTITLRSEGTYAITVSSVAFTGAGVTLGEVSVNGSSYDWTSNRYGDEIFLGTYEEVVWNTTSVYGDDIKTEFYSVPTPDIYVRPWWMRTSSYTAEEGEVVSPMISMVYNSTEPLYRVTIINSRFSNENSVLKQEVSVDGTGSAVNVSSVGWHDVVGTGDGYRCMGGVCTDAESFIVHYGSSPAWLMSSGTNLTDGSSSIFSINTTVRHVFLNGTSNNLSISIHGVSFAANVMVAYCGNDTWVRKDGSVLVEGSDWSCNGEDGISLFGDGGEFEVFNGEVPEPPVPEHSGKTFGGIRFGGITLR